MKVLQGVILALALSCASAFLFDGFGFGNIGGANEAVSDVEAVESANAASQGATNLESAFSNRGADQAAVDVRQLDNNVC